MASIAIVGCGALGLSAALELKGRLPSAHVTIIAESFPPNTNSDGAGALWRPIYLDKTPEVDQRRWCHSTFEYLLNLKRAGLENEAGVFFCSGYDLDAHHKAPLPYWKDMVVGFREVDSSELERVGTSLWKEAKTAWFYTTFMIDSTKFLLFLMRKCREKGISFVQKKVELLSSLYDDFDLIVNCSGCGAKQLVGDERVIPGRGITLRYHAPWIKQFCIMSGFSNHAEDGEFSHVFPRSDVVVVGGIKQPNNSATRSSREEEERIEKLALEFEPSLATAQRINTWTGFRPLRDAVRLEAERVTGNHRARMIIHNYGHGGSGLTIWQGCAEDVAKLARLALEGSSAKL